MDRASIALAGDFTLDLVFDKKNNVFTPRPGGSVLNTAVALTTLGVAPLIYGVYGNDIAGRIIEDFLVKKGITSRNISCSEDYRTSLALAVLDENGKPAYSFYRDERPLVTLPLMNDISCKLFHYSSSFAINDRSYRLLGEIRESFIKQNAIITYDLNLRKKVTEETEHRILSNIHHSTIIKGSDEDFALLLGSAEQIVIEKFIAENNIEILIMTMGATGAAVYYKGRKLFVEQTESTGGYSTIGAGDSFMGGFIAGLARADFIISDIDGLADCVRMGNETAVSYIKGN